MRIKRKKVARFSMGQNGAREEVILRFQRQKTLGKVIEIELANVPMDGFKKRKGGPRISLVMCCA